MNEQKQVNENEATSAQSALNVRLATRRATASHKHIVFGTLYQLSKPDDDFPDNAWWFNEASEMWQVSDFTNSEIKHGKQFEVVANAELRGDQQRTQNDE